MRRTSGQDVPDELRWNHNIHYHPLLLELGPARRALDIGCGEGLLCRQLSGLADEVVGIDPHEPSIDLARLTTTDPGIDYVLGDVMTHDFEPASFDLVVSVAALHHLDAAPALRRFAELVAPGGRLGVVGIGRDRIPHDLPWMARMTVTTRYEQWIRGRKMWDHSAPIVWPPPDTYAESRASAERELPGCQFRRHALGRFSIVWTRPT